MLITPANAEANGFDLPKAEAPKKNKGGRKPGYVSERRKFRSKTKVVRVPEEWDVAEINEGLEYLASIMDDARREVAEAQARSAKGKASNRYEKLVGFLDQMEDLFPQTFKASE